MCQVADFTACQKKEIEATCQIVSRSSPRASFAAYRKIGLETLNLQYPGQTKDKAMVKGEQSTKLFKNNLLGQAVV